MRCDGRLYGAHPGNHQLLFERGRVGMADRCASCLEAESGKDALDAAAPQSLISLARRLATRAKAAKSLPPSPCATASIRLSRSTLANGIGTCPSSPAASAKRTSFSA